MIRSLGGINRARTLLEGEELSRDLHLFIRAAWHLIEPGTPLIPNFHIDAIADHLQAVSAGQIKKLLINVPPRTGKSSIVSILWPAWEWAFNPASRWLFASYALNLSVRDSVRRRMVITSPWYQERYGHYFNLAGDQNLKTEFENSERGYMIATSVGGSVTGRGGDRLVIDDPHQPTEAESEIVRLSTEEWFNLQWSTRKNSLADAAEVIIMQRLHERDISGIVLEQGGWEHLKIPMERAESISVTSLPWQDPRPLVGDSLDPVRFPPKAIDELKRRLGPYGYAGQAQQEPAPAEGGIIKRAWINHYDKLDDGRISILDALYQFDPFAHIRFATVDIAVTEKEVGEKKQNDPDYTVICGWTVFVTPQGPALCLLDMIRERCEGPDILPKIHALHKVWNFNMIGVETVAFQKTIFQQARREGLPVREISTSTDESVLYRIDKDKIARVYAATPLLADRRFWVPTYAPYLGDFIKELIYFPNAAHDDMVDNVSAAVAIAGTIRAIAIPSGEDSIPSPPRPGDEINRSHLDDDPKSRSEWDAINVPDPYGGR